MSRSKNRGKAPHGIRREPVQGGHSATQRPDEALPGQPTESDQPEKPKVPSYEMAPSVAYEQATKSPVYVLSELMFGSLLAAYVLGFIAFAGGRAATVNTASSGLALAVVNPSMPPALSLLDKVLASPALTIWTWLWISVSYAYITAGMYVSYHKQISTMGHMPLGRLRWDFMVALSHAILFGLSMLYPRGFPAMIGLVLGIGWWRQGYEARAHAYHYYEKIQAPSSGIRADPGKERTGFRNLFYSRVGELPALKDWKPRTRWSALLIVFTLFALFLVVSRATGGWVSEVTSIGVTVDPAWTNGIVALVTFVLGLVVIVRGHGTLRDNASLLLDIRSSMDEAYNELMTLYRPQNTIK